MTAAKKKTTKVIFDAGCLGYKVGDERAIDAELADRLVRAGAVHLPGEEAMTPNNAPEKGTLGRVLFAARQSERQSKLNL